MKQIKMALALGLVAMTASNAFAEICYPIDGVGEPREGVRKMSGSANYCDNGDHYWHFDFFTSSGWLFLDGHLAFLHLP